MSIRRSERLRSKSIAEQISGLCDPKPIPFHLGVEELQDETSAKVCDFAYEEEDEPESESSTPSRRARHGANQTIRDRMGASFEDNPKYAGEVVSRKELEEDNVEGSGSEIDSDYSDFSDMNSLVKTTLYDRLNMDQSDASMSKEEDNEEEIEEPQDDVIPHQSSEEEVGGVKALPTSLKENIEKGKAAQKQIKLLDGILEARIKLQGVLSLSNRLPSPHVMPLFIEQGGEAIVEAMEETDKKFRGLLDVLLDLQRTLVSKNKEMKKRCPEEGGRMEDDDDEDIPSDCEEDVMSERESSDEGDSGEEGSDVELLRSVRKRRRRGGGEGKASKVLARDYEDEIAGLHQVIRPYRDSVVTKWNEKTKLATGKISSKAFVESDRSILSQIEHVLKDKERLRKRTQLKRSVYRILGEEEREDEEEKQLNGGRDSHLKDHNEHIFDDDDFYHQLLRELIERKTSYSESSDPIEMGRQWLELQKLRTKAKKKVDTKASKGRKIRYNVHPQLLNFMAPVDGGTFSDSSKNDLFSSLFGSRRNRM